jgi:hypothetical protein
MMKTVTDAVEAVRRVLHETCKDMRSEDYMAVLQELAGDIDGISVLYTVIVLLLMAVAFSQLTIRALRQQLVQPGRTVQPSPITESGTSSSPFAHPDEVVRGHVGSVMDSGDDFSSRCLSGVSSKGLRSNTLSSCGSGYTVYLVPHDMTEPLSKDDPALSGYLEYRESQ